MTQNFIRIISICLGQDSETFEGVKHLHIVVYIFFEGGYLIAIPQVYLDIVRKQLFMGNFL